MPSAVPLAYQKNPVLPAGLGGIHGTVGPLDQNGVLFTGNILRDPYANRHVNFRAGQG